MTIECLTYPSSFHKMPPALVDTTPAQDALTASLYLITRLPN
jgi:hypothetical protein